MTASEATSGTHALSGEAARQCALAAAQGDRGAFDAIVAHFSERLLRYLMAGGLGQADAEDITQETLVRAYQNLDRYDSRYAVSTWLFTIAHRLRCNHFRDRRPAVPIDDNLLPQACEESSDDPLLDTVWATARSLLPERHYDILWLRYGEDMELADIASVVGISKVNARVLLHRARSRLGKHLKNNATPSATTSPAGVQS